MSMPRLPYPRTAHISAGLLLFTCLIAPVSAQTMHRHVAVDGHKTYSDRSEAPIARRALAPLPGQTGWASEMDGRTPGISPALSQSVNRREAGRRLVQAQHERARGPDMQQGIPPIAERHPGDRRRERVAALQEMVEAAQARVRELDAPVPIAQNQPQAAPRAALQMMDKKALVLVTARD